MNIMEQKIWDYIDGSLSEEENTVVGNLIKSDPVYKSLYNEFNSLNRSLLSLDLDEPSMSFNRRIMEKIESEAIPGSVRSIVDKRIIYSIAGFFMFTIGGLLLYLFMSFDWTNMSIAEPGVFVLSELNYSALISGNVLNTFLAIDLVLVFLFLDAVLRKKMVSKKL